MMLNMKRVKTILREGAPGRYRDGRGLYLQITKEGYRSWVFRYSRGIGKKEGMLGLGPLADFNLEEARERARKARQQLHDGVDPLDARKKERAARALEAAKAITFEQAAQQYFDGHADKWRNPKHRAQFISTLAAYAFPRIGRLSVADIDTGQVLKVVEPIWKTKTITADRVRARIEAVLDWAAVRGYRTGDNPARWRGHLSEVLPAKGKIAKTTHHAAMPFAQLPEFMTALADREGTAARGLAFTILTAARTGEVIGAKWGEIDIKQKVWTVPAERIKGGKPHRVPLSPAAIAILEALPTEAHNEFVFIGPRAGGLSNMAMAQLLKRMGQGNVTVHGFRSCFKDFCRERTNYPDEISELALAHVNDDQTRAAYSRSDLFEKRRRLMAEWAKFCTNGSAKGVAKVISLREARR